MLNAFLGSINQIERRSAVQAVMVSAQQSPIFACCLIQVVA